MTEVMTATEERRLIRAAQQGSSGAFRQLLLDYDEAFLGLALRVTGAPGEARGFYRTAMLRTFESLAGFRFECSFCVWIYRSVADVSLEYLRRRQQAGCEDFLQSLTPREWMTVELKHYHWQSLRNIGEMLGTTEEAARQALLRGIRKLCTRLHEYDSVNPGP